MQRRKFLQTSALSATALGVGALPLKATATRGPAPTDRDLIEWRTYELAFRGNQGLLTTYLSEVLQPALTRKGASQFLLFREMGKQEPARLHLVVAYPDAVTYLSAQDLSADAEYQAAAAAYRALPADQPIYNRFVSSLLSGFTGMPQVVAPDDDSTLFELRLYEGYSEDAVSRKIAMFNQEEIDLFHRVGLDPVFFGELLAGPYRPALVYLLQFEDMTERDANWKKFGDHPDWNTMKAKPEYADTVSNIRRTFLELV